MCGVMDWWADGLLDEWVGGLADGQMDGWVDEGMSGRMDGWES